MSNVNTSFFQSNDAAVRQAREELVRLEKAVQEERRRVVVQANLSEDNQLRRKESDNRDPFKRRS